MPPRDPERIDRMLELLREAWHLHPDSRLTQLIVNASDIHHDCGPVYYLEDTALEEKLKQLVAWSKKRKEDGLVIQSSEGRPPLQRLHLYPGEREKD
jgi:hypothetical protein